MSLWLLQSVLVVVVLEQLGDIFRFRADWPVVARRRMFVRHFSRRLHSAPSIRAAFDAILACFRKICRQHSTLLELAQQLTRLRKLLVKLRRRHIQDSQVLNFVLGNSIGDLFRVELLIDVVSQDPSPSRVRHPRAARQNQAGSGRERCAVLQSGPGLLHASVPHQGKRADCATIIDMRALTRLNDGLVCLRISCSVRRIRRRRLVRKNLADWIFLVTLLLCWSAGCWSCLRLRISNRTSVPLLINRPHAEEVVVFRHALHRERR